MSRVELFLSNVKTVPSFRLELNGKSLLSLRSYHWESFLWCGVYLCWFVEYVKFHKTFSALLGLFSVDHRKRFSLTSIFHHTKH